MGIDARILVKVKRTITPEEIRKLSFDACAIFGAERFFQYGLGQYEWKPEGQHAIERVDEYEQDGPTLKPKPGETFLRVNVWTRYYGEGYERGDWPFLSHLLQWLIDRIGGDERGTVWYGGDSSGVCVERYDERKIRALDTYFYSCGHEPYASVFSSIGSKSDVPEVRCEFCDVPPARHGFGKGFGSWECNGCSSAWEFRNGELIQTHAVGGREIAKPTIPVI